MTTEILASSPNALPLVPTTLCQTELERTSCKIQHLLASAFSIFAGVAMAMLWGIPIGLLAAGIGIGATLISSRGVSEGGPPQLQENNEQPAAAPIVAKSFSAERNVEIYNETMAYAAEHFEASCEKVAFGSVVITRNATLSRTDYPKHIDSRVYVANKSTLRMTEDLVKRGLNPLVLDMANAYFAGGGVRRGANAQEEILCRQSNLMVGLLSVEQNGNFPIPELGGIFFPRVTFFRADPNEEYSFLEKPFEADVYALAAYCCVPDSDDKPPSFQEYRSNTKTKIRNFFRTALLRNFDSIVASALGCGAFKNDPVLIATLFKELLESDEFKGRFKEVAFGIIEDQSSQGRKGNYQVFKEIIEG